MKNVIQNSFVVLLLCTLAQPAFSQTLLGISHQDRAHSPRISAQLEEASGNLITVHNYDSNKTLLNMLTKFKKIDAALMTRQRYEQQDSDQLIDLGEVQVSGEEDSRTLVLAARSDLTEEQKYQLVQGYQEILMSSEGLELLEQYADLPAPAVKPVAAVKTAPPTQKVKPAAKPVITKPSQAKPKKPAVPVTPTRSSEKEPPVIPVEVIQDEAPASVDPPPPVQLAKKEPATETSVATEEEPKSKRAGDVLTKEAAAPPPSTPEATQKRWAPHIEITGKLGNDRNLAEAELFFPLSQAPDSLLYADLRFQGDDNSTTEGNFGLGYRKMINDRWILGAYGFYDLQSSENDNDFEQFTFGLEALSVSHDVRLNFYFADEDDYLIGKQESLDQVVYSGNYLVYQTGGTAYETREKSMSGIDAEVGWLLPWFDHEVRGYLGAYHFSASGTDDITGPRGRLAIRFPEVFGWSGSRFELGGEISHDDVRDTDYFISARARFPLGTSRQINQEAQTGLSARMTERVHRDPDIVVGEKRKDNSVPVNNEILTDNSSQITFTHLDSQAVAGDGSFESPYNALTDSNASIVLLYADSVFDNQRITLSDNQRLLGEPKEHFINTDQLGTILLPRASSGVNAPTINNILFSGQSVTAGENSEISGLTILGSDVGIYAEQLGGSVTIDAVTIQGSDVGIYAKQLGGTLYVSGSGNSIEAVGGSALHIEDTTVDLTFDSLSSTNSSNEGVFFNNVSGTGATNGLLVTGTTTINNAGTDGVSLQNSTADVDLGDLTIDGTGGDGIEVSNYQGTASFGDATVANTTADGVHLSNNAAGSNVLFNTATINNATSGLNIDNNDGTVSINGGTITQTSSDAVNISGGTGDVTVAADITNALGKSVAISNRGGGTITISANIDDTGEGIRLTDNAAGTVTFSGTSKVLRTGVYNAVTLANNSGSTTSFTNGGLDVDTTNGTGLIATNGGTLSISGSGNSVTTGTGVAIKLDDVVLDNVSGVSFDSIETGALSAGNNAIDIANVSGGDFSGGIVTVSSTEIADAISIEDSAAASNFSEVRLANVDGSGMNLDDSGPVTVNGGYIYNTASFGVKALNTPVSIDNVSFGGSAASEEIGGAAISIVAENTAPIDFSIKNSTIENVQGNAIQVEAYNAAVITSGTISGTTINDVLGYGIDVYAREGATIDNLLIGDPAATQPGDVAISNTGVEGIFITAGNSTNPSDSEAGTVNTQINAVSIDGSNGLANVWLESLGLGTASYSITNSHLDAADSTFDSVYLRVLSFEPTDRPSLTANIIDNDLTNGPATGMKAYNLSSGALNMYLLDNTAANTPYAFELENAGSGTMSLYNTVPYSDAEDLLINQGNTGGTNLLNTSGVIDIEPLP